MTKSEMMVEAHRIAREELEGDYQAKLAIALKMVWKEVKQVENTIELEIDRFNGSCTEIYIDKNEPKEKVEKLANKYDIEIDYTLDCPKIELKQFIAEGRIQDYIDLLKELDEVNGDHRLKQLIKKGEQAK